MTVRLSLFGSPSITHGGTSSALPFERRSQMLVFLALKRVWVGRAELAAMLWPEQASKLALTNLRKILFRMQSLPWADLLESHEGAIRFAAETDVADFERALRERRLPDALSLRRGDLLPGFDDDHSEAWSSWLQFERDRLRVAWRGAALDRLAAGIDPVEGIALSTSLLEIDPLDETALQAQMECLARSGQSARARQVYREFAVRLQEDLGLAPGTGLRSLHDSLSVAGNVAWPLKHLPAAPHDDGFVGRSTELRRIAALLAQDDCRMVTIVGPGGAGKTRLAQRALRDLAGQFADGAAFIRLEDASSARELGGRLAADLDITLSGGAEPMVQVIDALRDRQMLLVLDNFEQLLGVASAIGRLADACAGLRFIATSRVRLALPFEWLVPLEGLPCPEIEDQDRIEAFDAVRLFVKAAQRVEPALVPSVEAAAIVEICREVEGLPLALELAAAWTRLLSCEAIAAELRHGAELLRAVDAAQPSRHASVELVFEQSLRMLSVTERETLSRLAVFRGGFTAEAGRAIASASLPVLGALIDKSLLRKDGARIFFHPLVQQLAGARLDHAARATTERAHAVYFHRMLAQLQRPIEHGDSQALRQVDAEFENCRIAWRWAVAQRALDLLTRSAPALFHFCDHTNRFEEGLALLGEARDVAAALVTPALAAQLAGASAHLEYRLDRYAEAEASATQALAVAEAAGDHNSMAHCLQVLGSCALRLGRHADASSFWRQACEHAQSGSDPRKAAANLYNQAVAEKAMGNYDESLRLSLQALAQQQRLGDFVGQALAFNNLGLLYFIRQDYATAGEHLRAGLAICDQHNLPGAKVHALGNLTELAVHTKDFASAINYANRGMEIAEAAGNRAIASWLKIQLARIAALRGDLAGARDNLRAALQIASALGRPDLQLESVRCLADIFAAQNETECARRLLVFAADHPSIAAPERGAIQAELARWPQQKSPVWPGMTLTELVNRVIVETDIAHAALIATLRAA